MSQRFGWLLCLSPFHSLLYLLNLFCGCFLPIPFITTCIEFVDCLGEIHNIPVIQLSCNGQVHAYNRQLKKGVIWWKKTLHCLLNPSTPITYNFFLLKINSCCCCSMFTYMVNFSLIISIFTTSSIRLRNVKVLRQTY